MNGLNEPVLSDGRVQDKILARHILCDMTEVSCSNHMLPPTPAVCRVGKGGPDGSIDSGRQIRRAHRQRCGGHGGICAVPTGHVSAALAHPTMLTFERRRRDEAAEFALDQLGECNRGAVPQMGADDLHADRQAFVAERDRHRGRRQPR
jgi:hypothetical protein